MLALIVEIKRGRIMTIGHEIFGQGSEGVIVLHGWFGDHTVFAPTMAALDTETYTYAFVNYRGYGLSKDQVGDYTMAEISADSIALADELGWDKFHLVGHSMGGMAAQRVALDAPGRVKSIVAVTPVPASGVPLDEDGQALFNGAPDNDDNRYTILDFTTGNRLSSFWLKGKVRASREQTTRDAYAGYLKAWTETNFADEVNGLNLPVLVLYGENDPAFTEDAMKQTYMTWLPTAELAMIANAGHYPMQEAPIDLATKIEAFLAAHA